MSEISLQGIWELNMGSEDLPRIYPLNIMLPGTTSRAGLGPKAQTRESGRLTDLHPFEGRCWYRKMLDWPGGEAVLEMERTRRSRIWLDGREMGSETSLCTPHVYPLGHVEAGRHELVVCVENTGYMTGGHMVSGDTQTNWNGILGRICLRSPGPEYVHISPETGKMDMAWPGKCRARVRIDGGKWQELESENGRFRLELGELEPWDEDSPVMHELEAEAGDVRICHRFGLRRVTHHGRELRINGKILYLRGRHDGMVFPNTGYAPMDVNSWRRHLQCARDYGLNHVRFHTCCPPEAAFDAADELGMYLEPELPFWGSAEKGDVQDWLTREGLRILDRYAHHPSFVLFSLGNELWGDEMCLREKLRMFREKEPGILYTAGSNNYQFVPRIEPEEDVFVGVRLQKHRLIRGSYAMCDAPLGIVQTTEPESLSSYDTAVLCPETEGENAGNIQVQVGTGVKEVQADTGDALVPQVPVISHEVGQYSFYPDFREIGKYTGNLRAYNLDIFRERLEKAGLYNDHERYFDAAGHLALECYRREIETLLRTREMSGFQMLDLQDFPGQGTALVGMLNAFMESKGLISPEEFRMFCSDPVILAGMERFWFLPGKFRVQVQASDLRNRAGERVQLELRRDGQVLDRAESFLEKGGGRLRAGTEAVLHAPDTDRPIKCTLDLCTDTGVKNSYPVWIFPENRDVCITPQGVDIPGKCLRFGRDLLVTDAADKPGATYASDFWNYTMFAGISRSMGKPEPDGTLGLCIREHPLLAGFPCEGWTTPPWHPLLKIAHLDEISRPGVVEMIDNWERCRRWGLLYETEQGWACTFRFWEAPEHPVVRAFARSLTEALGRA